MSAQTADNRTHTVHVAAPAGVVYALIADAVKWPLFFTPSVHVEQLEFDGERERLRIWCLMDGRLKSWTAWRQLDPVRRTVEFRQELPASPFRSLSGLLSVRPDGPHGTELELRYDFSVSEDSLADESRVAAIAAHNAAAELANLRAVAERWTRLDDLVVSFEDSMHINGPAELVYNFLYRAEDWPELVPHVTRVDLAEDVPGVQHMTVETLTEYGAHTTDSVRICFPHAERILYKDTSTSPLVAAHTGEWSVVPDERGVTVLAQHSVVLSDEGIATGPGEHASLAHARRYVRESLGRNCQVLLTHAKKYAESAVRML
jgi:uncharacterized membrane protein